MIVDPVLRRVASVTSLLVAAAVVAACSLPADDRVTPIDQDDFPSDLTEETTTTTTPSSTTTTTVAPGGTNQPTESTTTTTTLPEVPTEFVTVYYTRGVSDVLAPVDVGRAIGTPIQELVPLLESPTGISDVGLRSWVLFGLIDDIVVERGTATVSLDRNVLDRMSNTNQQRAIAQIALTVTSFRTSDAGAVGRVRFEVDGEGFPVFVPAFGGSSEPGEELAFTDFEDLIATTPTPATSPSTTTTTTTTTTTIAAAETSDLADEAGS